MPPKIIFVVAAALSLATTACAATLEVGAGKTYTTLGTAAAAAQDGDTVIVYPGTYSTGAVWTANALTIEASPGAKLGAVTIKGPVNNKGIFEIRGDDATVIGLKFEYAKVADANGAGIRSEGHNITVRNCEFYANETGILITAVAGHQGGSVTVDASIFDLNGTTLSAYSHAIYANYVGSVSVINSTFTREILGHYIKSRATSTYIHDNHIDDTSGSASYLINLPQGGSADIQNNVLIKGAKASNCCIAISYGEEMYKGVDYQNAPGPVLIANNPFTNLSAHGVYFVKNASTPSNPVALVGNVLTAKAGMIIPLLGPGTVQ